MIEVKIIKDSLSEEGVRLTTFACTYPRFIHSEVMTHRMLSRNASSSRAIPIEKMIEQVMNNPAMPERWGLNGKGMQDHGEMSDFSAKLTAGDWLRARDDAVASARTMLGRKEVPHKQIVNRLLEPYMHITTLLTATEWKNFFVLRNHPDADPTFAKLAAMMEYEYQINTPHKLYDGEWHLPFIDVETVDETIMHVVQDGPDRIGLMDVDYAVTELCCKRSIARCARVSYLNHEGKRSTIAEDLATFEKLVGGFPMHASPAEHAATPDFKNIIDGKWAQPFYHGNFVGWCQYRKFLIGENYPQHRS